MIHFNTTMQLSVTGRLNESEFLRLWKRVVMLKVKILCTHWRFFWKHEPCRHDLCVFWSVLRTSLITWMPQTLGVCQWINYRTLLKRQVSADGQTCDDWCFSYTVTHICVDWRVWNEWQHAQSHGYALRLRQWTDHTGELYIPGAAHGEHVQWVSSSSSLRIIPSYLKHMRYFS